MLELEKILEEIKERGNIQFASYTKPLIAVEDVEKIIRKHMLGKGTDVHTNNGWIPVEERLPDESLNSVIGWDEYRERCCFVQHYAGKWALRADREPIKITHWRPLPDRPGRSEGE